MQKSRRSTYISLMLAASVFLAACGLSEDGYSTPTGSPILSTSTLENTYTIDPVFDQFYEALGGEKLLGKAISPVMVEGMVREQFVEAGVMVYDPQAAQSERYQFGALGNEFDVAEAPVEPPSDPALRYVDGHIIYPEFVELYERLGGARFVGRPLTEARHNPDKGRIEQYFENLGFYKLDSDQTGVAHLLSYGAYVCDQRCRYQAPSASIPSLQPLLPDNFAAKAAVVGVGALGRTLTEPYINADGQMEVVFENMVLISEIREEPEPPPPPASVTWIPLILENNPNAHLPYENKAAAEAGVAEETVHVWVKPIVELLGIRPHALANRQEGPLWIFFEVANGKGYNIPALFDDFIRRNGGLELFGAPLTEVFAVDEQTFRQCFQNVCIDLASGAPEEQRLRLAPLGAVYKEKFVDKKSSERFSDLLEDVRLQVWETQPFVSSTQPNEIHVAVFQNNQALKDREPVLYVILPDKTQRKFYFPPTDENGLSVLTLPPISAPNGTLISYDVCLSGMSGQVICVGDNFLIWNYQ